MLDTDPATYGGLTPKYQKSVMRMMKDSKPYILRDGDLYLEMARATWKTAKMVAEMDQSGLSELEQDEMLERFIDVEGKHDKEPLFGVGDKVGERIGKMVVIDNADNEVIPQCSISWATLEDYQSRRKDLDNIRSLTQEDQARRLDVRDTYQEFNTSHWGLTSSRQIIDAKKPYKQDRKNRFEAHTNIQDHLTRRWHAPIPYHLRVHQDNDPDDKSQVIPFQMRARRGDEVIEDDTSHLVHGESESLYDSSVDEWQDDEGEPQPDTRLQDGLVAAKRKARKMWREYRRMVSRDRSLRLSGSAASEQSWASSAWDN